MMGVEQEPKAESGLSPRIGRSVTLDHAAQLLNVSRRTIYNRIRGGSLRTVRLANGSQRVAIERLTSALALVHNVLCGAQHERSVSSGRAPTTRIAHELEAVSRDSEVATQKILAAAEDIDQAADNLSAKF